MPDSGLDFQVKVLKPFQGEAEGVAVFEAVEHPPLNLQTRDVYVLYIYLFILSIYLFIYVFNNAL